jgi:hypothetical protein
MKLTYSLLALLFVVLSADYLGAQTTPIGLPVLFVHGYCDSPDSFLPAESAIKQTLESQYPALYPDLLTQPTPLPDEYVAFYDGTNVNFQVPGSSQSTSTSVDSHTRFFLVDFPDGISGDVLYQQFKPNELQVAQFSILHKGYELAHIIWRIKQITGAPRVIVVGHSMGGLDSRAYIENLASSTDTVETLTYGGFVNTIPYFSDIANLVTLDTPHGGALLAGLPFAFGGCNTQTSTNRSEMAPSGTASLIPLINYANVSAVTQPTALPPAITITSIASYWSGIYYQPDDGLVLPSVPFLSLNAQELAANVSVPPAYVLNFPSETTSFSNTFPASDGSGTCGVGTQLLLHSLLCTGSAQQTFSLIQSAIAPSIRMYQNVPVSPAPAYIQVGSSVQLNATTLSGGPAIWSLREGSYAGSITSSGLYTAPATPCYFNSLSCDYHAEVIDSIHHDHYGEIVLHVVTSVPSGYGATSTALNTSATSLAPGQSVTLTATVSGTGATPTGTVTFAATSTGISSGALGTENLVNGVATYTGPVWNGLDTVTATYNGDSSNSSSTSSAVTISEASSEITLSFAATTVGSSTATQNFSFPVNAAEIINSITVPLSQGGIAEFSIGTITGCTIGVSNPAGSICTVPITFTPAYPGLRQVPLLVSTSLGTFSFGLSGTGTGPQAALTPGIITTVAGNGTRGYSGDNGAATSSQLNYPSAVVIDNAGNMYIADSHNEVIRKVGINGTITTVAGNGYTDPVEGGGGFSGDGGHATNAELSWPGSIALDSAGNIYFCDDNNNRIRKIDTNGIITTVVGNGTAGFSGDNGPATSAAIKSPYGLVIDSKGNLYFTDGFDGGTGTVTGICCRVRKVDPNGIITTIVGNGTPGFSGDGGPATNAVLNLLSFEPMQDLALDNAGNLYIADTNNYRIRRVDTSGTITTVAGIGNISGNSGENVSALTVNIFPWSLAVDSANNLYLIQPYSRVVRKIDANGIISTVAGWSNNGYAGDNGPATYALFTDPTELALDNSGNIFVVDQRNNVIRKIDVSRSALSYTSPTNIGTKDSTDGAQTVSIYNTGNAPLSLTIPASGSNPSIASGFAYDAASTCPQLNSSSSPYSLAAGGDCIYAVDFVPTVAGANTGSLVITGNSLGISGTTQVTSLSGTGVSSQQASTTTLLSSPSSPVYGQSLAVTVTVAGATPTGNVTLSVDGTSVATQALSSGSTTFTLTALNAGSHSLSAAYAGDSNNTSSTGSGSFTVGQASQAITFHMSGNPTYCSLPITLSATGGASGNPVTFSIIAGSGYATLSGTNNSTLTIKGVGTVVVAADQAGTTNYTAATEATSSIVIGKCTINPSVSSSSSNIAPSQSVTLTASITGSGPSSPTGTVSFYAQPSGGSQTTLASNVSIANGSATYTGTLPSGTDAITIGYSGDANYNSVASSSAITVYDAVASASSTTLTTSSTNVTPGQGITLTATVSGSGATPSGTVTFSSTSTGPSSGLLGTATLVNGVASYTGLIWVGSDVVTATYNGDSNYSPSTSNTVTIINQSVLGKLTLNWPFLNWAQPIPYGGSSGTWPVTLQNQTGVSVAAPNLSFSGAGASNFTISSNTCTGTLTQGASCTFNVSFTPTSGGSAGGTSVSATLTASTSTSSNYSASIPVSGVALSSSLTFNWPFLNFTPSVAVGATSSAWPVTMTNQSGTSTTLASPAVTFTDTSFTVSSDTCSGATLGAGASCTFSVKFSPIAADIAHGGTNVIGGTLSALGNSGAVTGTLPVGGWATSAIGFNWPFVTFQNQPIGSTGTNLWPVTVTNYSGQTLSSLSYTFTGVSNYATGAFTLSNTCSSLAPGASCTFNIAPSPQSGQTTGAYSATLVVSGSGLSSPALSVSGSVIAGGFAINWNQDQQAGVSTIDFGPQNTKNVTAGPWPITVFNNTPTAETLTLAPSLGVFTIDSSDNSCTGSVPSGGSCTFGLDFTPTADTSYKGTLTITGNVSGSYSFNTWGAANK